MYKLIDQTKGKLKNAREKLKTLTLETEENKVEVDKVRKFVYASYGIAIFLALVGHLALNSLVVLLGLAGMLATTPFGFKIFNLDDKIEKGEKEIETLKEEITEHENELDRLYSRQEVLNIIQSKQNKVDTQNTIQVNVNKNDNIHENKR